VRQLGRATDHHDVRVGPGDSEGVIDAPRWAGAVENPIESARVREFAFDRFV